MVNLCEAMASLLRGDLATPPADHWWYFGSSDEPLLIAMSGTPEWTG